MTTQLTLIHALTPLHAGTGQAVGAIDLPIARERPTGIPLLPGSSLKGALRARTADQRLRTEIFGPETANASDHAGAVQFSDAHLLLLPVRSLWGTFAWVTSPYLLQRFARDLREAGITMKLPRPPASLERCLVPPGSALSGDPSGRVVLEDLDFAPDPRPELAQLAEQLDQWLHAGEPPQARHHLCVVHDDVMSTLMETATEVRARIALDDEVKTVKRGALWYEESLPCESVLFGLTTATDAWARGGVGRKAGELLAHLAREVGDTTLQLGGKATVGRGVCRVRFIGGAA